MSKAYLAGGVNQALVSREDGLYVLEGALRTATRLDGYVFSQWRLSRQEIRETEYAEESEIFEQLYIESVQSNALQEALELMDSNFSEQYRRKIAVILIERIRVHAGLLDYLTNRFYSNRLPEDFNEHLAIDVLVKEETPLSDLYHDLAKKTKLFDVFYTRFWLKLKLSDEEQNLIDDLLTNGSVFAHFTNALYTHSVTLYDYAADLALKTVAEIESPLNRQFFIDLRDELAHQVNFRFRDVLPFPQLLSQHWLINVKPYRFFGSPVKTIYNYLNDFLPFSTEQTVQVLLETHLPIRTQHERQDEHEQKLYWQSVNDLDFFASIAEQDPLHSIDIMHRLSNVQQCVRMVQYKHQSHYFDHIPIQRLQRYTALLYADCTFLRQDFTEAVLLYSELKADIDRTRHRRPNYDHTILNSSVLVRLGKSYEMLNETKKAVNFYRRAFRILIGFVGRQSSVVDLQGLHPVDQEDILRAAYPAIYAEAVAGKVADLIASSEHRNP